MYEHSVTKVSLTCVQVKLCFCTCKQEKLCTNVWTQNCCFMWNRPAFCPNKPFGARKRTSIWIFGLPGSWIVTELNYSTKPTLSFQSLQVWPLWLSWQGNFCMQCPCAHIWVPWGRTDLWRRRGPLRSVAGSRPRPSPRGLSRSPGDVCKEIGNLKNLRKISYFLIW